jgi:hypothetical protein
LSETEAYTHGDGIQKALVEELKKSTPYVRAEPSACRFDCVAYIPDKLLIGKKDKPQLACVHRYRRFYCYLQWEALREEASISGEEEKALESAWLKEHPTEREWTAHYRIPHYRLGDKSFSEPHHLWASFREVCRCDENPDCPSFNENYQELHEKYHGHFANGLHVFEIKSDGDDHSRLVYQIPQMIFLADYAWLVLGEKQEIPTWLPPFVGIMRFNEEDKNFSIERIVTLIDRTPTQYWQVLEDHGYPTGLNADDVLSLNQKWIINAIFRWKHKELVVDMTEELENIMEWMKQVGSKIPATKQKSLDDIEGEGE